MGIHGTGEMPKDFCCSIDNYYIFRDGRRGRMTGEEPKRK